MSGGAGMVWPEWYAGIQGFMSLSVLTPHRDRDVRCFISACWAVTSTGSMEAVNSTTPPLPS